MSFVELSPTEMKLLIRVISDFGADGNEYGMKRLKESLVNQGVNIHEDLRVFAFAAGPSSYAANKIATLEQKLSSLQQQLDITQVTMRQQAQKLKDLQGSTSKSAINQQIADNRMSKDEIEDKIDVVFSYFKQGRNFVEISKATGMKENTIKGRMNSQRPSQSIDCSLTTGIPTYEEAWELAICLFVKSIHPTLDKRQKSWKKPFLDYLGVPSGDLTYKEYQKLAKTFDLKKVDTLRAEYRALFPNGQQSLTPNVPQPPVYASMDALLSIITEHSPVSKKEIVKKLEALNMSKNTKRLFDLKVSGKIIEVDSDVYCAA